MAASRQAPQQVQLHKMSPTETAGVLWTALSPLHPPSPHLQPASHTTWHELRLAWLPPVAQASPEADQSVGREWPC
eukprot:5841588-Amphidinium_carterae.1